jgi:hypothetical protein
MNDLRRAGPRLIPLLAGLILAQGLLAVLPHEHHGEIVIADAPGLTACAPAPHMHRVAQVLPAKRCLACAVHTPVLSQPEAAADLGELGAAATDAPADRSPAAIERRWRAPLRGPPSLA